MMTATAPAPEILWTPAPADLTLAGSELQMFCASRDLSDVRLAKLALTLSGDERVRAERFRFDKDRRRFIASRGLLRELLGRLLGVKPDRLAFAYTARGKPVLATPVGGRRLHFNVAHSDSLAIYAAAWDYEIGIDIERLRPIEGAEAIASRFFSGRELAQWRSVPSCQRTEAFFNCWTRKEACLKATGDGISDLLSQVEVSLIPGHPARLFNMAGDPRAATCWLLQSLTPARTYLGTVAAPQGAHLGIHCWKW